MPERVVVEWKEVWVLALERAPGWWRERERELVEWMWVWVLAREGLPTHHPRSHGGGGECGTSVILK